MTRRINATTLRVATSAIAMLAAGVPFAAHAQTADQGAATQLCADGTAPSQDHPCAPDTTTSAQDLSQTGASADTDIVVTGSRIAHRGNDSVAPTLVVDSQTIESRGFETLGQALSEQPAFGVADSSPVGAQSSFGPGQSFVNFFGLGSQRTLTLVNGQRFVGSNTSSVFGPTGTGGSQVDLNLIPTKLIDRTEIVAVGGAPIYGSDAIAGTINIILKKNYEGLDVDGQYGISGYGDAPNYRFRLLAGHNFADGRGNITVAGEYNNSTGLLYTDRSLTNLGRYLDTPQDPDYKYTKQLYNGYTYPGLSGSGIPLVGRVGYDLLGLNAPIAPKYQEYYGDLLGELGYTNGEPFNLGVSGIGGNPETALKFDNSGKLIPIDFGLPTSIVNSSGGNGYGFQNISNLLTNTKRYSGIVTGSYAISDHIRFTGEAWYSHSEGTNLADQPEYWSGLLGEPGTAGGDIKLSVNNPYLTSGQRAEIIDSINRNPFSDVNQGYVASQDYFYLGRALTDITTGRVKGQVDIQRYVANLDGDFSPFSDKVWKWQLSGNYGRSVTQSVIPTVNSQNFFNAVGSVTDDNPNGVPCLAGLASSDGPTISSNCAPLDLFGNGIATQDAANYVTMLAHPRSVNTEYDFLATVNGPLAKLPGGDLAFSLGYEHRSEHSTFNPSAAFSGPGDGTSYGQTVAMAGIDDGYHTNEIFGELQADLIGPDNNIPLIHSLNLQFAGRYVDNSFNGGAFTWTAGGRWAPVRDLTIRGNFTRSIRSPSITEFAAPSQQVFNFADDPCDSTEINNNPTRAKNCTAALIAAGVAPDQVKNYDSLSDNRSFHQGIAGDPTLKNETANSFSIGGVLNPSFLPRFNLSADYVNISVNGVITSFDADQTLKACYDSSNYPNTYCDRITRDPTGQLSNVITGYVNADKLHYRGIIAQGDYSIPTPFLGEDSRLGLGVSYQHLFELTTTTEGVVTHSDGGAGYSKNKALVTLSWANKNFEYFAQADYIGPATATLDEPANYRYHNYYNAIVFTDMGVSFTVENRLKFSVNVDNIFGTKPPFPATGATDVYFRGLLGRYFRFGAGLHF